MNKPASFVALAIAMALVAPSALFAQAAGAAGEAGRCAVVADTIKPLTPVQVQDRTRFRESIVRTFRETGHPATGLLYVDLDTLRRGTVAFVETEPPAATRESATREIALYLETLEAGRAYHTLIRLDGDDYPVIAPGKQHCVPELDNPGDLVELRQRVSEGHPLAGRGRQMQPLQVTLILIVDRTGNVVWAHLEKPTGDSYVDQYAEAIGYNLRFLPASVDGVPIDARTRFTFTLGIG